MELRALALLAAVSLAIVPPAAARTGPNPEGRLVLNAVGGAATPLQSRVAPPAPVVTVNVPLPSGAVLLDSTYYDLQDMGSLGTRIAAGPDGRIHVTYLREFCELDANGCPPNLNLPQPFPQRAMGYWYRDTNGAWHAAGKVQDPGIRNCCVTEQFGGFGTLALTSDGRAAIAQHMNEDGCDLRGDFYLEGAPGGSTWKAYLTPIQSPSYLFPQVTALPNGSFVVLGEVPLTPPTYFYEGTADFRISRLASAGASFVCPTGWQGGPWTSVVSFSTFRHATPGFPSLASASDGRVGIAVTDFGADVFLIESSNGTFNAGTVTLRKLTNYSDATITQPDTTSNEWRPYMHCHLAYNDTTPHVVWSELQARRVSGSLKYADRRSRIRHWSSVDGLTTVKQVQAGEADTYDDIDNGGAGPIAGFNTLSVDWPQVGFSADGAETYVGWQRYVDAEVDPSANAGLPGIITGIGFGDVALSVSHAGGAWSSPQNLTNTPTTDERFFSLAARNTGGLAHVVFQASATNQSGVALIGDRGDAPGNIVRRIAYLERPIGGSLVSVDAGLTGAPSPLRVFPNPSPGRTSFALDRRDAGPRESTVLVYSVSGRLVARLPLGRGAVVEWSGGDQSGRKLASGVYLARLEGRRDLRPVKFMLLR